VIIQRFSVPARGERVRVAVFGDVHANLRALQAVCVDIERAGVEDVWCLGDFASGGAQPAECFDLTMSVASVVLAGNHEQFVMERVWTVLDGGWARQARLAAAELGTERVDRLRALQPHVVLPDLGVELVHGSLLDPWSGFVESAATAEASLARSSQPLVIVGHTHRAAYFREAGVGAVPQSRAIELGREHEIDRTSILNPGAALDQRWLELTRDRDGWCATWHHVGVG
jgi:predicted phosphodiesterase